MIEATATKFGTHIWGTRIQKIKVLGQERVFNVVLPPYEGSAVTVRKCFLNGARDQLWSDA